MGWVVVVSYTWVLECPLGKFLLDLYVCLYGFRFGLVRAGDLLALVLFCCFAACGLCVLCLYFEFVF